MAVRDNSPGGCFRCPSPAPTQISPTSAKIISLIYLTIFSDIAGSFGWAPTGEPATHRPQNDLAGSFWPPPPPPLAATAGISRGNSLYIGHKWS